MKTKLLVGRPIDASAGEMTWNEEQTLGFYGEYPNSPCVELFQLTREKASRADITISTEGGSWNTNEGGPDREFKCEGLGSASLPEFSPDERTLAFFATPEPPESSGTGRFEASWSLYLSSPTGSTPKSVLDGVVGPLSLAWSNNGYFIAFTGVYDDRPGTWLYDRRRDEVAFIDEARGGVEWSPTDQSITINDTDTPSDESQLIHITLDETGSNE